MNYKKLAFAMAALCWLGAAAFAEISLKDIGNGQVSITFTYKDDTDPELDVIGSFDNWTVPGEPMTKNAAGLWEKTITAATTDEIQYKFYMKGTWITDVMAPDQKDDGFGGHNGLIVVADILSGAVPAVPGAPPAPVAVGGPKKPSGPPKMYFSTQTFVESDTNFNTGSGSLLSPDNSQVTAYSDWQFLGNFIPGMPGHIEILLAQGQSPVYTKNTLDAGTGTQNLAGGLLFSPFYYLYGNQRPTIDKFEIGVKSPWVEYDTGYGNTRFPTHQSILWQTTTGGLLAGQGFSSFRLGSDLRDWGDVSVDAAVVPNVSLNKYYGLTSWANVEAYGVKLEGQYDLFSSTSTDPGQYFNQPSKQNVILGAESYFFDDFFLRGQFLNTSYADGTSGALVDAKERYAFKVVAGYRDTSYDDAGVTIGWAYRGLAANLIFSNIADSNLILGAIDTNVYSFDGFQKFGYWGEVKLGATMVVPTVDPSTTNNITTVRPGFVFKFDKLELAPIETEVYAQLVNNTVPPAGVAVFSAQALGAKVSVADPVKDAVKQLDLYYKWDSATPNELFQSLLAEAKIIGDVTTQAGVGYRSGSAATSNAAFVLGASYQVPVPAAKTPTIYAQFVYNMDPYNTANSPISGVNAAKATLASSYPGGPTQPIQAFDPARYDLTDFGPTNGATAFDGLGALRLGIEWQF